MLCTLPLELVYGVTRWLEYTDYVKLRACSKWLSSLTESPTLVFEAYRKSIESTISRPIKLDLEYISEESLLFLASCGHVDQFNRALKLRSHIIPVSAKERALAEVILHDQSPEMVMTLLKDSSVNPAIKVSFMLKEHLFVSNGSVLNWACMHGHVELVRLLLLDDRVDVNAKDEEGWHSLMFSIICDNNQLEVLSVVLADPRTDFNSPDSEGWTPFHHAACRGSLKLVSLFLSEDYKQHFMRDLNTTNVFGKRPVDLALERNVNWNIIQILGR
jgi:Ankyrin repeats (many copies)/Ankyrin repeat